MANSGDELFNPATGLRTLFRRTREETNGELLQVDSIAAGPWTTGPRARRLQARAQDGDRLETLAGLAQDGKTTLAGAPKNPFRLAPVLRHLEDEIHLARPPLAVQRVLLGAVAGSAGCSATSPSTPIPAAFSQWTNQ
jgi:hypothetical protein